MKKLLTVAIVLALLSVSLTIAGNAYGKVKNTESAKACIGVNQRIDADELGVVPGIGDEVVQCLQQYGIAVNSGVCTEGPDGCCNPVAESDPDCITGACDPCSGGVCDGICDVFTDGPSCPDCAQ